MSGRIIIDSEAFERFNPDRIENFDDLKDTDFTVSQVPEIQEKTTNRARGDFGVVQVSPKIKLTEESHLLCRETVSGYSLKLKKWRKLSAETELYSS